MELRMLEDSFFSKEYSKSGIISILDPFLKTFDKDSVQENYRSGGISIYNEETAEIFNFAFDDNREGNLLKMYHSNKQKPSEEVKRFAKRMIELNFEHNIIMKLECLKNSHDELLIELSNDNNAFLVKKPNLDNVMLEESPLYFKLEKENGKWNIYELEYDFGTDEFQKVNFSNNRYIPEKIKNVVGSDVIREGCVDNQKVYVFNENGCRTTAYLSKENKIDNVVKNELKPKRQRKVKVF